MGVKRWSQEMGSMTDPGGGLEEVIIGDGVNDGPGVG